MNFIDFQQSNLTLGAGPNPNTGPLRVSVCKNEQMPNYAGHFLVSAWQMNAEEEYKFKQKLLEFMNEEMANRVINSLPITYLSCMGSMTPVMILQDEPDAIFRNGFMKPDIDYTNRLNEINNRPKDN